MFAQHIAVLYTNFVKKYLRLNFFFFLLPFCNLNGVLKQFYKICVEVQSCIFLKTAVNECLVILLNETVSDTLFVGLYSLL